MSRRIETVNGQGRLIIDSMSGNVVGLAFVGQDSFNRPIAEPKINVIPEIVPRKSVKPDIAYMNIENLGIIRDRVLRRRLLLDTSSYEALAKELVVFRGGTKIELSPKEELQRGYSVRLNIGVIACTTSVLEDDLETPFNRDSYQILGVYNQYKGTGRVSTDKATREHITIQRSDVNHPQSFAIYECFFANPQDAIKVKKSNFGKTGYWSKK